MGESGLSWQERILTSAQLREFFNGQDAESFPARVEALLAQQRASWQALREGYEALAQVETKRLDFDGSSVVVQYNPKRLRSTAAAVDRASVQARRCFLCADNLPPEEKGIAYGDELVILCNPFPVLDRHLVIAHREHREQRIEGFVEAMLSLARDLGDDYFVLYNGAACGASAPDHFHLQALARAELPIIETLRRNEPVAEEDCNVCEDAARGQFELFTIGDAGRSVIVFRGGSCFEVTAWVEQIIESLAQTTGATAEENAAKRTGNNTLSNARRESPNNSLNESPDEPMLNLIAYREQGVWTVLLFARARHRPARFFAPEPERLLVSPGAVDMAGVVVVPEAAHFEKLGAAEVEAIFAEVSQPLAHIEAVLEAICDG